MANQDRQIGPPPRWGESIVHPRRRANLAAAHRGERWSDGRYLAAYRRLLARHRRLIKRVAISCGVLVGLLVLGCAGLWWRLSTGPIQVDAFSPWLVAAIEENFGSRERVEVGGTQIERTANGGAAVRVRDIVVRDPDGSVVASAPKAEIRVSGLSLLSGHMRAESLSLVGAELAVRIEQDGNITVFASSADKHPIASASAPLVGAPLVGAAVARAHLCHRRITGRSINPLRRQYCRAIQRRRELQRHIRRPRTASPPSWRGSTASANQGSTAMTCANSG